MKEIKLSRGQVALVDDEDYEFLNQWKWCAEKRGHGFYAKRSEKRKTVLMHRVIMGMVNTDGRIVDHKDRNGLNNQRCNLREATRSQNQFNRRNYGKVPYIGVTFDPKRNKYEAKIKIGDSRKRIGRYNNAIDAAKAYNELAIKHRGEYANLNII